MSIGSRIKEARLRKNLTQEELAHLIGVTKGAIANYENQVSIPKLDILLKLMGSLECDANYIYQDDMHRSEKEPHKDDSDASISNAELDHIKKYRTLDGHGKETVDVVLDKEYQRMEEIKRAKERKALKPKAAVIDIRQYWNAPSAGYGNDLGDGDYDVIQVPDTLTARLASYALTVSGHSMEPDLMDGDVVFVKSQETYEIGDIVVFAKNGDSYIKYAGEHCFESANPDYPDIEIGEDDSVRCFGVVLGKL